MHPITLEKCPVAFTALHYGLSDEAAWETYHARCAALARGNDYEVQGRLYRATSRCDAQMQYEDETGVLAPLWAVVEVA